MTAEAVIRQLGTLSGREREVLKLRCQDADHTEISQALGIAKSTVSEYIQRIYAKLNLDQYETRTERWMILRSVYCPALLATLPPPPPEPQTPTPIPGHIVRMVEEDERAVVVWQEESETRTGTGGGRIRIGTQDRALPPPTGRDRGSSGWLMPFLFGIFLTLGVIAFLIWRSGLIPVAQGSATDVPAQISEDNPESIEPSATPEPIATTPVPPTPMPTIDATGTALVFAAQTQEALPTETPEPTGTPEPTNTLRPTLTPTPPPLFEDDFTGGMSDQWSVEFGEPVIVNDAITSGSDFGISVGDLSWTNYEVTLEARNMNCGISVDIAIGLRATDLNNKMMVIWCGRNRGWYTQTNGQLVGIPNSGFTPPPVIRVSVVDNIYSVVGVNSVVNEDYPSGKVIIHVDRGVIIDNVKIVPLP